jgi:heme/copper-type cytochrome/quinol oxidase subunit 4
MKQDGVWAFIVGIVLTLLALLVVDQLVFPNDAAGFWIAGLGIGLFLWLNAYRLSRKKAKSSLNPPI